MSTEATLLEIQELLQRAQRLLGQVKKTHKDAPSPEGKPDLSALTTKEKEQLRAHLKEKLAWRGMSPQQRAQQPQKDGKPARPDRLPPATIARLARKAGTSPERLMKSAAVFFRWHPEA